MSHLLPRRSFLGLGLGGAISALTGIDAVADAKSARTPVNLPIAFGLTWQCLLTAALICRSRRRLV